jgi:hypothetical protein
VTAEVRRPAIALLAFTLLAACTPGVGNPRTLSPPGIQIGPAVVSDSFARLVTGGWGTAPLGGTWKQEKGDASDVSVDGSAGAFSIHAAPFLSAEQILTLPDTSTVDFRGQFDVTWVEDVNALHPQYGGVVAYLVARFQNTTAHGYYRMGVSWDADTGHLILRTQNAAGAGFPGDFTIERTTALDPSRDFPGGPYGPYHVKVQIVGSSSTTFASKIWREGFTEPTKWMLTGKDNKNRGPQVAGPIGFRASNDLATGPSYLDVTAHLRITHISVDSIRPS